MTIMPLPLSGKSMSAVIVHDLLSIGGELPRGSATMPGKYASFVRPAIKLGRPIASELNRSEARQSSGRTLYFAASTHHRSCIWRSFSGFASATSLAWLKSWSMLYSSQFCLSGSNAPQLALCCCGTPGRWARWS